MRMSIPAALIAVTGSAMAQEAVAAPAPAASPAASPETEPAAPAKSAEELAIEAQAAEFRTALGRMQDELLNTTTVEEGDAVVARYQPQADALADRMNAFLIAHANDPANAARRDELLTQAANGVQQVRSIPAMIRKTMDDGKAAARAAAPAGTAAAPAS